ncbi:UDP-N-acetylmuramate dehydrogenase [Antrihabitans sp. YC2-6]|uniref:UDP-N-acetylmuramate dehydrogenase n=1 Tax=Antrihabitans sp. YC2-6 TaxID=2799498 RepID=UPI0018F62B85|nr:UDP-N-acetylmuramate dehydrogenase [Antrihabitans sp. YC2-6]
MCGTLPFAIVLLPQVRDELERSGAQLRANVSLAGLTTLRVGGPARVLAECTTTDALVGTVRALDAAGVPTLVVAGGSNLLIADAGFDGVVVRVATTDVRIDGSLVTAQAGAEWDAVVAQSIAAGLGGIECLSGIPGSAGATPVQNVGAYGVEISSVLRSVDLLDRTTGEVRRVAPAELGLGYRTSVLKHSDRALVLAAEFELRRDGSSAPIAYRELAGVLGVEQGDSLAPEKVREAVLRLRRGKGMVLAADDNDTWSAGSFFTNPIVTQDHLPGVLEAIAAKVGDVTVPQYPAAGGVKLSAGWLIERAGYEKGFPGVDAPARLSTKHTLALTNRGNASAGDIVALAQTVRDGVRAVFGVTLEPEPVAVGVTV